MKFVFDIHTHTMASGHAYHTIDDMLEGAREAGLTHLGIAEHTLYIPGTANPIYMANYRSVIKDKMKERYGVELLLGAEMNIIDPKGRVDLPKRLIQKLDYTLASIHGPCFFYHDEETCTAASVAALQNPMVDILAHPDDGRHPINYEILVPAAKKAGKLIELNNTSLKQNSPRPGARENAKRMLLLCMREEQPIVVNTDAHSRDLVGRFDEAEALLQEVHFPEELVVNTSIDRLLQYIRDKK